VAAFKLGWFSGNFTYAFAMIAAVTGPIAALVAVACQVAHPEHQRK
jgi:hypothetical protein